MRTLGLAALALLMLAILTAPAYAQGGGAWHLLSSSDGALWVTADGMRHRVVAQAPPDDLIETIPLGEPWGYTFGGMTAATPAQPAAGTVTIDGSGTLKSRLFQVAGGNYTLQWTATPKVATGCFHAGALQSTDFPSVLETVGSELLKDANPKSGETQAYGLKPGKYFLSMTSGCDWRVTIAQQQ